MMMNNPVDLFAEYAALNSGFCTVEPGGYFAYLTNSGSDPLTLCVSADGISFSTQVLSINEPIVNVGTPTPFIDFSGAACMGGGAFGGTFVVFTYNLPAADGCIAQSKAFTVWLVNNSVYLVREDDACMYELWGVSPADGSDIIPDITMPSEWITPKMDVQVQVERRDVEPLLNECLGPATIAYDSLEYIGTPVAAYTGPYGTVQGPIVTHTISTDTLQTTGIQIGGYIDYITIAGLGSVGMSGLIRNGVDHPHTTAGAQAYASYLSGALQTTLGMGNNFRIRIVNSGIYGFKIEATCANSVGWYGLDKTSCTLSWCNAGGCPTPNAYRTSTTVTQTVGGDFSKNFPDVFDPCDKSLGMWVQSCPLRADLEIFDLAGCNYNTLSLQNESGRRYYIFDYHNALGEGVGRQCICQTTTIEIQGSGCATPPGPAVFTWQGGGTNPKEFSPKDQDTAESDCGGCVAEVTYCLPEARDGGHAGTAGLLCQTAMSSTLIQSITSLIEDCNGNSGGAMTLTSLSVHDVPAAFTSCTPAPGAKTITSVHPADILPRTYYYAYKYTTTLLPFSNYGLIRVNILPGNCCT